MFESQSGLIWGLRIGVQLGLPRVPKTDELLRIFRRGPLRERIGPAK